MSDNDGRPPPREREVFWVDDSGVTPGPAPGDPILSIDNVARMFRISRLTLRYYEFRGMIKRRRNIGDVRVYGWADCDRIAFIIKCRRAGVARSEILTLIETVDELADGPQEGRAEGCLALIERLERRRRSLDDGLAELRHLYTLLGTKSGGPHGGADRG